MTTLPIALMTDDEVARLGRDVEEGFGAMQTARGGLPLVAMDVDVRVAGIVASVELAQTFVNSSATPIEATYVFPLPDRAAVHRFRMEAGARVIDGVIDERGDARAAYAAAIAAGQLAAITEEDRPGLFTLRVGNLMPGEAATVRLSLVGPLPVDDGEITFRFPLVVAPRYVPGTALGGDQAGLGTSVDTDLVPDGSRISPPVRLPGHGNPVRLGLRVALEDHGVRDVVVSLHAVTTTLRDAHVVELRPNERLDRDFILRWRADGPHLRSSLVCVDDDDGRAGTFAVTLFPPSTTTLSAKPRDVVFVIDRSGSMEGWKMVAARRAAARMIDTLTSRDRFCAIAFDDGVEAFPEPGLVDATDRHRFRAVERLAKLDARGGTELLAPLAHALGLFAARPAARERVIVLVTDGQVGNEDHVLHELAPSVRDVRMFALGIDQAVNAGFLKRLAATGGGLCELVESEDRLDEVMAKVHRRIGRPIATELSLRAENLEIEAVTPSRIPDVYAGAPVTILGRYRGRATAIATVELIGSTLGDPLKVTIPRDGEARRGGWLAASWARAAIRDLEDRYAAGAHEHEPEIVRISKQHGVLSRFTAFLAVDRSGVVNQGGKLTQVVQPVEQPAGWEAARASLSPPPPAPPPSVANYYASKTFGAPAAMPPSAPAPMIMPTGPIASPARAQASAIGPRSSGSSGGGAPLGARPSSTLAGTVRPVRSEPIDSARYLAALGQLAHELDALVQRGLDPTTLRLVRQRLTEWVEDLRSVGGHDALAALVARLVTRLTAALANGSNLGTEVAAIAAELTAIAGSGGPAPTPGRVAFWK